MPHTVLDQLGHRLPLRQIWQGGISCGDVAASLTVIGGHPEAQWANQNLDARGWYVASNTLSIVKRRQDIIRGQLLAVTLVADLLPTIAQELRVYPHQLSVGLAVADAAASYWIAGLEYAVRSITLLGTPKQRNMPLGQSGLAVRQLQAGSLALDVDVLIVAPECLSWTTGLSLRRRTAVIITDGSACADFIGCSSVAFQVYHPAELPHELLAGPGDLLPLSEALVLSSYLAISRSIWSIRLPQQLSLVRRALDWSEWGWKWELGTVDDAGQVVPKTGSETHGVSVVKHI